MNEMLGVKQSLYTISYNTNRKLVMHEKQIKMMICLKPSALNTSLMRNWLICLFVCKMQRNIW